MAEKQKRSVVRLPETLRLQGEMKIKGNAILATGFEGKLRVRDHLTIEPEGSCRGRIQSHSLEIVSGAKVEAEVRVGSLLPLTWRWFRPWMWGWSPKKPGSSNDE